MTYQKYTPEERINAFWSKINKSAGANECWIWMASRNTKGYGTLRWDCRTFLAHRVAFLISHGEFPDGLQVLHKCDNPPCCNPAHLFLGTQADNAADREAKGRGHQPSGEHHGKYKLTDAQVADIRELYATGNHSQIGLGKRFNVSPTQIAHIVHRRQRA